MDHDGSMPIPQQSVPHEHGLVRARDRFGIVSLLFSWERYLFSIILIQKLLDHPRPRHYAQAELTQR